MARAAAQAFASLRRWRTDLRTAALERHIRQDPGNLGHRSEAAAHYLRQVTMLSETRTQDGFLGLLFSGGSSSSRSVPREAAEPASTCSQVEEEEEELLGRASEHLESVLQGCDDIHRLHDVLSRAVGPKLFYRLPKLTARYMRKIGLNRECLEEFDTRSEFEERATPYHLANALAILKASGEREAAQELFQEAKELEWQGRRPIGWQTLVQTPAVYVEGLEHRPFWDEERRPAIASLLEENRAQVMEDLQEMLALRAARRGAQVPAYPPLVEGQGGVWDMLQLYSGRRWNEDACDLMPRTSALLRAHLPTADVPYVHYNTEEVVVFLLAPGSRVRLHNGGSNVPINLSLGLSGCEGSYLEVAGETRPFRDGRVLCFDDGSDHRVWHEGEQERWVLTVRSMHPQLAADPASYFSRAFTRRTCFETWGEKRAQELSLGA